MTGCELIRCPDYKNKKCTSTIDTVNKNTGEDMCPRNEDAINREDYENEL